MSFDRKELRQNMRRLRIQPLLNEILSIVSRHLSDEDDRRNAMREIHDGLFAKLYDQGVEIITDNMRADMGLPARGPDGWTVEEILALEQRRLEVMSRPLSFTVPPNWPVK